MKGTGRQTDRATAIPWYSLNPRYIRLRRIFLPVILFLLLYPCSEKHYWRWAWQHGFHAYANCRPIADARGRQVEAWRWVEGKEIRLYTSAYFPTSRVRLDAANMQDLLDGLGLNITIRILPQPARVSRAIARSVIRKHQQASVSFPRLCRELVASRDGRYAEMVYVPGMIDAEPEVTGSAVFSYGVGILNARLSTCITARHELGHLLGYHMHDSWPLLVLGYANPQWASRRSKQTGEYQTLMMPDAAGYELSPRSHDALIFFWRGLEQRTGQHYFVARPAPPAAGLGAAPNLRAPAAHAL